MKEDEQEKNDNKNMKIRRHLINNLIKICF